MLSRRHLRIRVMQALYAWHQSDKDTARAERELFNGTEHMYRLYLQLLCFLTELGHREDLYYADQPASALTGKRKKATRYLQENSFIHWLKNNKEFQNLVSVHHISWQTDIDVTSKAFFELRKMPFYTEYINSINTSPESEIAFAKSLVGELISKKEFVRHVIEEKNIFLKPFVIGLGLDISLKKTFECVGRYFDATNETMFRDALNIVISQALNNTTMQVNLLDQLHNPTETNVNMTFTDFHSGAIKYNFIHTINSRGNPDTLVLDPLPIYKIKVHTLPPVTIDSVLLTPGKHTIIGIDAPQGYLLLKFDGAAEYKKVQSIIRLHSDMKTLNVQDINAQEKYIVGKYDLEILTTPRVYLENVDVSQSKTTTVRIPRPGLVTVISNNQGYGSIYTEDNSGLKWVYNLDDSLSKETIVLQPGRYRVVYRPKNSKESIYTLEKEFSVVSGESNIVLLN